MSAHECMNLARERAEKAEAALAAAESERDTLAELLCEANEREKRAEAALAEVREWATPRFGGGILAILARHGYEGAS